MHFYWQRRRFSPRLVRFTSGFIIILLLLAIFLSYFRSIHAAGGTAPGGPGVASFWTPSNNTFLGTAQNTTSDVWFTGYNGVIGEVFYPTADMPNTTDLQFLVGDSSHTLVDEEKVATTSQVHLYNSHSLAWTVTNTATNGKYRITKIIYTDPTRNSLIQQVTFTALNGNLSNYLLYALYNPTMHDAGNNNFSSTQVYNGATMLVTTDSSGNYASALILAGDTADPQRALRWAFTFQQQPDGHFPQNSFVNGTPYWTGIQEDEQAFPIILAWKLAVTDSSDYQNHIKPAANYIITHGPFTGEERWEENSGFSPSTVAAEIAGLLCAANIAGINGDTINQARYTNYADYYQALVPDWTFTTSGSLRGGSYFERIDDDGNPNDGHSITIANGGGTYDERSIVDAGFLELVRQGVMPANSPYITQSLPAIDSTIKQTINGNSYWYRYNHDGYGEHAGGSNYNGNGIGRLWPMLSGERGVYTIATGSSADGYLTAMTAAENGSGLIPEQVWDSSSPTGYTPGTPTMSMEPLNWSMGEFITLLMSANSNSIADVPSLSYSRYITNAYQPHTGRVVDYDTSQLYQGKALTIFYKGPLVPHSHDYLHWGENNWQNVVAVDKPMVKRADGFWQTTISLPVDATQINFAFNDGSGNWDDNGGGNWNVTINANGPLTPDFTMPVMSFPYVPVQSQQTKIIYNGSLEAGATSITMQWGYNGWIGATDVSMTKQNDGSWIGNAFLPQAANSLNMVFFNQSGTWDNNGGSNYTMQVSQR